MQERGLLSVIVTSRLVFFLYLLRGVGGEPVVVAKDDRVYLALERGLKKETHTRVP